MYEEFSQLISELLRGELSGAIGVKGTYGLSRYISARGVTVEASNKLAYLGRSVSAVHKRKDELEPSVIVD